jgi:hypothetical protein
MIGNTHIHPTGVEQIYDSLSEDGQPLAQENQALRAIVAELLIKNQNLRWALRGQSAALLTHEPRVLMTSGGTPLRRNARTAGIP